MLNVIFDGKLMVFVAVAHIFGVGDFFLSISYGVCIGDIIGCDCFVFLYLFSLALWMLVEWCHFNFYLRAQHFGDVLSFNFSSFFAFLNFNISMEKYFSSESILYVSSDLCVVLNYIARME